jgi:hypothetical protein
MPYIKERREELDKIVELMHELDVKADGDLNYILFKYCKYYVEEGYNNYKNFKGELSECRDEIGRRLLAPYENRKMAENGDVLQ